MCLLSYSTSTRTYITTTLRTLLLRMLLLTICTTHPYKPRIRTCLTHFLAIYVNPATLVWLSTAPDPILLYRLTVVNYTTTTTAVQTYRVVNYTTTTTTSLYSPCVPAAPRVRPCPWGLAFRPSRPSRDRRSFPAGPCFPAPRAPHPSPCGPPAPGPPAGRRLPAVRRDLAAPAVRCCPTRIDRKCHHIPQKNIIRL